MARITQKRKIFLFIIITALTFSLIPSFLMKADSIRLISANKPTSAFSSEARHDSSMAVDSTDNNSNYWGSSMGDNNNTWWQLDLQGAYAVTRINIRNWVDGTRYYHYYIRGSLDRINWMPLSVKSNNNPAVDSGDTFNLTATVRYIRVNVTYNSANHSAHISDFKVYGTPIVLPAASRVEISSAATDQGAYAVNSTIKLKYNLHNASKSKQTITNIKAQIAGLTNPLFLKEVNLAADITLSAGQTRTMNTASMWTIPSGTLTGAYAVYLQYTSNDGIVSEAYQTFFRITTSSQLTAYSISNQKTYKGMDIFKLNGGMSAEYAVAKSGEALSAGISNSWDIPGPKRGPAPIFSTPQFLEKSVQKTVDFYDSSFGSDTNYDTVIISTGVASVPYLARAMKAPVLPLHFLVSVDTTQELKTILDYSNSHGFSAYSTLGYDGSMPTGVAWVKMLTLPKAYKDFLNRHHVKNVVIMGSSGTTGGETTSKKLLGPGVSATGTNPGDIFIIYTNDGTSKDIAKLNLRIKDLFERPIEANYRHISDWESGVIQAQVDHFSRAIKSGTAVKAIDFVTGQTYIQVFNFATFAQLEFLKKNEAYLAKDGDPVKGIVLNPYLVSLPFYESRIHYVPLLFWQYDSMTSTVNTRVNQTVRNAVKAYFPNVDFNKLQFWIRSSKNFPADAITTMKNKLIDNGMTNVSIPSYSRDEVWNPADGMTAPNEVAATNLLNHSSAAAIKDWDAHLQPISMKDLESIPARYSGISVTRQ